MWVFSIKKSASLVLLHSEGSKTAQLARTGNRPLLYLTYSMASTSGEYLSSICSLPAGVCLKLEPRNGSPLHGPQTSPYSLLPSSDPQGFAVLNWFQLPSRFPPLFSLSLHMCLSFSPVCIYWLKTSTHVSQLYASQALPVPCWIKERIKAPHMFLAANLP